MKDVTEFVNMALMLRSSPQVLVTGHAESFNHFNENMYSTREDVRR